MTRNLNLVPGSLPRGPGSPLGPTARWLEARGLDAPIGERWKVSIELDTAGGTRTSPGDARLQLTIESFAWGVSVTQGARSSSIVVTHGPQIHERDDFGLLPQITDPAGLRNLVSWIERRLAVRFQRPHARIQTNLADAHQKILMWILVVL
jgi:hypothetical protein